MSVLGTAAAVQRFCVERGWRFCFIGGVAVQHWGQPRLTADVDVTVLTGFGLEEPFIDALLGQFPARRDDAREFALNNRVVLLADADGTGIDVSFGALPFEERLLERAQNHELAPGLRLTLCSAEDLVVLKTFAGRHIDWADVERIVARQGEALDHALVLSEVAPLLELKGASEDLATLKGILLRSASAG